MLTTSLFGISEQLQNLLEKCVWCDDGHLSKILFPGIWLPKNKGIHFHQRNTFPSKGGK